MILVATDGEVQSSQDNDQTEETEQGNDDEHRLVEEHDFIERVMNFEVLNVLEECITFGENDHRTAGGVRGRWGCEGEGWVRVWGEGEGENSYHDLDFV